MLKRLLIVGTLLLDLALCPPAFSGSSAFNAIPNAAVSNITNSDGTLTVSPTTGAVVASINLAHANTWSALQTFNSTGDIYLNGGVAWTATYAGGNTGTSYAINIDNGNLQSTTITGAVAITLTTPTHPGKTTIVLTMDGTGHVYSISGCKWPGGTAITYSTAASKVDIISILYDGSNFYCMGGAAFS